MKERITRLFKFDALLLKQGWMKPAYVGVGVGGRIVFLSDHAPEQAHGMESVAGLALPGFPNAHSHAFQYAMAGMAEKHQPGTNDDFWSWREAMYECALSLDPEQIEAVAAMVYSEMLRRGYTHVAEFHYLHHDTQGHPYDNIAETGERLLAAAEHAGIRITLIPVFYQKGGFGKEPMPRQRRFICAHPDDYLKLLDATQTVVSKSANAQLGFGVHSLRAVTAADITTVFESGPKDLPFHIHAAEQLQEVEDCKAFLKRRPVEWLLENLPLQERFNLVHCTHLSDTEVKRLATSGAQVVLCPGTEGNLGDGIFRLKDYASQYGSWCIGTDSHISLNPFEDLRWLDYAQRLTTHKRNTFDDAATVFLTKCITGGRKAMGLSDHNFFEEGKPFDAVIFQSNTPLLNMSREEHILSSIVYTCDAADIMGTIVNGSWVVRDGIARNSTAIRNKFDRAMKELSR